VMDESTQFDVVTLDQSVFSSTLSQGAIFIQLNSLATGQTLSVNTPRGTVSIKQAGRYEIVAGDTNDATLVTVVDGAAHVSATGMDLDVGPQQTASIGGSDTFQGNVGAMQQDAFLQAQLRVVPARVAASVPRAVQYMTGGAELASYGSYTQTQQYGQVWYPRDVPRDWAPYRDGHWAYVSPWGWTWVDNARWGFAPFHYGRWVQVQDRWGWVAGGGGEAAPGYQSNYGGGGGGYEYPVYSPALVTFVGVAAGVGIGISIGAGEFAPAWVPLGPREPYYPWYHVRSDYFARMNQPYGVPRNIIERGPTYINNVHNTTIINNTNIRQTFINERAATVIPAAAFARGEGVMRAGRPLPAQAFANARPMVGRLPVRPTAYTPNLEPAAARRFDVRVPARPVQPAAAGPRIVQAAPGVRAVPELRRASLPQNIHAVPANQVRPGAMAAPIRPGLPAERPAAEAQHGLPQLRPPGARPGAIAARPGEPPAPGLHAPDTAGRPELRKPGADSVGREARPGEARPGEARSSEARPGEAPRVASPYAPRPPVAPHIEPPHTAERPELHGTGNTPPRQGASRETAPRAEHAAPRAEAPRAQPHPEAPRPAPHVEAPRPAPHAEAPRPAPHVEEPRPAPHAEAPRQAPHVEAPRPAPHVEAPRQAPHPEPHAGHKDEKHPN
jgi:hypothetical protein